MELKKKVKRIYKYATGDEVPEGAVYLWSCKNGTITNKDLSVGGFPRNYKYVWHYFLVEVLE